MSKFTHEVTIIGAGLAGLTTAVFLGLNGVKALLIERNSSTSILPKARGQNPITMEAMRAAGVAEMIRATRPAGVPGITSRVTESLTGRVFWDHLEHRPDFSKFSPEIPGMASQARQEAALLVRARQLGVEIRFEWNCTSLIENPDSVELLANNLKTGESEKIISKYVVAADGIRGEIGGWLNISTHGLGHLKSVTAVQFEADLSRWTDENAMFIHYVKNPQLPEGSGILISTDYKKRWVANFSADKNRTEQETANLIKILTGINDLEFKVIGSTTYNYWHRVADRMSTKRVFLAGDAAHVMPPTGGQGGNTATQDGYYLGWKLAYVLRGIAGEKLLESYDKERRPYAEIVVTWQAANLAERRDMKSLAERTGEPIDHATMMFGYVCRDGAFVRDESVPVPPKDYPFESPLSPTGAPGARIPYTDLIAIDGPAFNTRKILGQFFQVYFVDYPMLGDIQRIGNEVRVPQLATAVESLSPIKSDNYKIVLVRPDGIVAWRGNNVLELENVYKAILDIG